jgi:hypothetical protein
MKNEGKLNGIISWRFGIIVTIHMVGIFCGRWYILVCGTVQNLATLQS